MIKALTPEQVADTLQINVNTVYTMIKNGDLIAKKISKKSYRISPLSLSWLYSAPLDQDILEKDREDRKNLNNIHQTISDIRK